MTDGTYQLLPPLADEEYQALKASIATFGVLTPVVLDEDGKVLDGHHRLRACAELGVVDYPRTILPGLSEDQKVEQALTLNLARRHLSIEQKHRLVSDLRARGLSVRAISEKTGIPRSTVARHTSAGVPSGTPAYVTGQDGKRYRARHEYPRPRLEDLEERIQQADREADELRAEAQQITDGLRENIADLEAWIGDDEARRWKVLSLLGQSPVDLGTFVKCLLEILELKDSEVHP
jgi:hypothetical protein